MNVCPVCHREYPTALSVCPDDGGSLEALDPTSIRQLTPAPRDTLIGKSLSSYLVRERIGQGGMGVVYKAEQPEIGRFVAIKVLAPEFAGDPEQLRRLTEEARAVNAIRHRGIIDIFGFGAIPDGRQYIVMELLEGVSLDAHLARSGRLSAEEAIPILDEVLAAIGAAHRAGVVHRDLKPGNVFLARQSDGVQYVKVLDFGLAKRSSASDGAVAQTAMRPCGTPEYMAPEQARGDSVSPRTDLYAVGVIAYEMLSGKLPFQAPSYVEIMLKHLNDAPAPLAGLSPPVPPELDALVLELLEKEPQARPSSAGVARSRLKKIARELENLGTKICLSPFAPEEAEEPLPGERAASPGSRDSARLPAVLEIPADADLPGDRTVLVPVRSSPRASASPSRAPVPRAADPPADDSRAAPRRASREAPAAWDKTVQIPAPRPRRRSAELPPAPETPEARPSDEVAAAHDVPDGPGSDVEPPTTKIAPRHRTSQPRLAKTAVLPRVERPGPKPKPGFAWAVLGIAVVLVVALLTLGLFLKCGAPRSATSGPAAGGASTR